MILQTKNVNAFYGQSQALFDVGFEIEEGMCVCILGRNGAGKTTTLKSIMGLMSSAYKCSTTGEILYNGKNLLGMAPNKISNLGIGYVPQGRHIFPNLTVLENLTLAGRKGVNGESYWTLEKIFELFPRLQERLKSMGNMLSGGEQQMLAVARGLMINPQFLIMDEICEGLAPIIVLELGEIIKELQKQGVTILLAEQNVKFAKLVSQKCYFIEKGSIAGSGMTNEIPDEVFKERLGV